jgi:hypothetical protein
MDSDPIHVFNLGDVEVAIRGDVLTALMYLAPPCAGPNPLRRHRQNPRDVEVLLFARGLIDADGNPTALGRRVLVAAEDEERDLVASLVAEQEMDELDELDRACRQRPRADYYDGEPADPRDVV